MTLVDTSAWVHCLRATRTDAHRPVRRLIESNGALHTTEVVEMEVLAGGRDETHAGHLRRLLSRCEFVRIEGSATSSAPLRCTDAAGEPMRPCVRLPIA